MNTIFHGCFFIIFSAFIAGTVQAQSHYPGQHSDKMKLADRGPMKAYCFNLQDICLLSGPFMDNMDRESKWILSLSTRQLLHSFRNNAGVYSASEGGYDAFNKLGGWESLDCDLRGHTTGHILSGLALLYASTGNDTYKIKADSLVKGLADVQIALNQDGYLSAFSQGLIDRTIQGQAVWAPWYTLHKIMAGLIDQYLYCDNRLALDVASKMAQWAFKKLQPLTPQQRTLMLRNEFGGINESFYNLFAITGNMNNKWLAEFFYHNDMLDPLKGGQDILEGKHANTYIPKLLGLVRDYEIEGTKTSDSIAEFFWNTVVDHHSFCTGSNSDKEKFYKKDSNAAHLSGYTGESCNVYNMLKLTRHLFCVNADEKYAEYYERALFNHILGQQDPQTGMVAYFLPMLPGAHKVYSTHDSSFWCCVGSGFENQAKYGEAIYYHTDKALYINLFIASELNWKEKGVKVHQETKFPDENFSIFTIRSASPIEMPILLRYPCWAVSGTVLKVNGHQQKVTQKPGSYISIDRKWKDGDKIEVSFPMTLRAIPTENDSIAAIAYGPVILAGMMGTEGMISPAPFSNPTLHNDYYAYNFHVPANLQHHLKLNLSNLSQYIKPLGEGHPLMFTTVHDGITLEPLFRIHHQRYVIYWNISHE